MLRFSRTILRGQRKARTNVFGRLDWKEPTEQQDPVAEFAVAENQDELVKALENILPKTFIPDPPTTASETWSPANVEKTKNYPYHIGRGKFHQIEDSVVEEEFEQLPYDVEQIWRYPQEPIVRITKILNITGDFDQLVEDVRKVISDYEQNIEYTQHAAYPPIYKSAAVAIRVHEPNQCIYIKGHWSHVLTPWLIDAGF